MSTIRVGYRRVFQTRQFESQTIELGIEEDGVSPKTRQSETVMLEGMAGLYRQLEAVGDQLMKDALARPDPVGRK